MSGSSLSSADPKDFIVALNHAFLEDFYSAAAEYLDLFPNDRAPLVAASRDLFGRYFKIARAAFSSDAAAAARGGGGMGGIGGGMGGIGGGGERVESRGELLPAKGLMAALATMAADLSGIHRMLPEASLGDRATEVVERAVRSRVGAAFTSLEADLADALDSAADVVSAAPPFSGSGSGSASNDGSGGGNPLLLRQFVVLSDALLSGVAEVLADVRALLEERPMLVASWREEFEGMIRGHATSLLHALLARLCVTAGLGSGSGSGRRVGSGAGAGGETRAFMFSPTSPLAPPTTHTSRQQRRRDGGGSSSGEIASGGVGVGSAAGTSTVFASTSTSAAALPAPLLLVYARLANFLQTDGVPHIARELEAFFPGGGGGGGGGDSGDIGGGGGGGGTFSADECLRMSEAAATSLVSAYVEASGRRLSLMVRKSVSTPNWLDMKEPRDVRPLADFLLDDLAGIEAETAQILEDGGHGHGGGGGGDGGGGGGGGVSGGGQGCPFIHSRAIAKKTTTCES